MMPRTILMRCDAFRRACLEKGKVEICDSLIDVSPRAQAINPSTGFDAERASLGKAANLSGLVNAADDAELGKFLRDTLDLYVRQIEPAETVDVVTKIIAASGGRADDIGKLKAGEFYFATEGSGKPGKVRTPICLSYHPSNPPAPDEVILRARR